VLQQYMYRESFNLILWILF